MQSAPQWNEAIRPPWAHLRIPPFPHIALQVLQLTSRPDASMRHVSDLITRDPAFASEVLTIVNSALYARRTPINSILQAIAVLGTDNLKGVCLTVGVRSYLGKALKQNSLRAIWRHGLATAVIAAEIAVAMSISKDSAYTAGIMHDLGRLALAVIRPAEYAALLVGHKGSAVSILEPERALFGYDHCQAGLFLISDWNLSPDFQLILDGHHSDPIGEEGQPWRVDDIVKVSCKMADTAGFAAFAGCEAMPYPELLQFIPERERKNLWPDFDSFRFEVSSKINTIEMIT